MTGTDAPDPTIAAFQQLDIRVGTVAAAEPFPEARTPAYKLWIDFGPEVGRLQSSAQVTDRYAPAALEGRQVAALINVPPKRIGPFVSACLVLGFPDGAGGVILIGPDAPVPDGGRLS